MNFARKSVLAICAMLILCCFVAVGVAAEVPGTTPLIPIETTDWRNTWETPSETTPVPDGTSETTPTESAPTETTPTETVPTETVVPTGTDRVKTSRGCKSAASGSGVMLAAACGALGLWIAKRPREEVNK